MEFTLDAHVAIRVVNGGYIVVGSNYQPEAPTSTTAVFSNVDNALAYARRILLEWEGSEEFAPEPGDDGNYRVKPPRNHG